MIKTDHLEMIKNQLDRGGPQGILLTGEAGKRWLFGGNVPQGDVVITKEALLLVSSFSQEEHSGIASVPAHSLRQWLRDNRISLLGVDDTALSYREYTDLEGQLRTRLYPYSHVLERLRGVKEPEEQELLFQAQQICDQAFHACLTWLRPGMTQAQVSAMLVRELVDRGAEELPFFPMVCPGPLSALPHGKPGNRTLSAGDLVVLDFGCRVKGYCADMTRTVKLGTATDLERRAYRGVYLAQQRSAERMIPGASGEAADRAARQLLNAMDLPGDFPHSLAHGIGLELHEDPAAAPGIRDVLQAGMVLALEPGVYYPDSWGIRLEDMVVIENGGARMLSQPPAQLPEV